VPPLLINNEKVKDPEKVPFSKDAFPCKFHSIKKVLKSEAELKIILLYLKSKNSFNYDEIRRKVLKAYASLISLPLTHVYSHSLYTGIFPDCLKISAVKQLFKKGDKTSETNCMPISLLKDFSKVQENFMYNILSHHMHSNKILVPEQFGFSQGKSTENATFKLTDSVLKSIKQKMHVG
jgi:hypothetical protein